MTRAGRHKEAPASRAKTKAQRALLSLLGRGEIVMNSWEFVPTKAAIKKRLSFFGVAPKAVDVMSGFGITTQQFCVHPEPSGGFSLLVFKSSIQESKNVFYRR